MKDVSNFLKQRIQEYNQKWEYHEDQDMASCIVHLLDEHFTAQQSKIAQLAIQKQNYFFNMLSIPEGVMQRQYLRASFASEHPLSLASGTLIYAQDKQGNEEPFELLSSVYVQSCHMKRILSVNGESQTIRDISAATEIHKSTSDKGEQRNALYFHIPNFFDYCENLAFDLCLTCDEPLWGYLLDKTAVKMYMQLKHEKLELTNIIQKDHVLHIEMDICEEQRLQITGLWILGIDCTSLMPQHLWDASFLWHGNNLRCDYIFGEEQVFEQEDVPLFDSPMRMGASCYICENETLSNPEAEVTLHFDLSSRCVEQGMQLLQSQEYHAIMRKLPLDMPIYDAYADLVVLEYFNGQAWCTIPNTQGIRSIFLQTEEKSYQIRFHRPRDLQPCVIMGKFAYYLRFRLIKSDHLYQLPCRVHVPYIAHVRFHYTMRHQIRASQTFLYSQLQKVDITDVLGTKGCTLFARVPVQGEALLLCFDKLDSRYPCTCYVDIAHTLANGSPLCIEYWKQGAFHPLYLEDTTDGWMHSGELTMRFPEVLEKNKWFEEEAYWFRLSFDDHSIPDITFHALIYNTAILAQKRNSLSEVAFMHIQQYHDVSVHAVHEPYGDSHKRTQEEQRDYMMHQFITRSHPITLMDMKTDILHMFLDIADILLLENRNAYQEQSKDCHVLILLKDMYHHTDLFHIRKKDVLMYLMSYEACILGKFIVEEPVFIQLSIHAICTAPQELLWQKQQALLDYIVSFLDPIHGGVHNQGIKIGEHLDMDAFKLQCLKHVQDVEIILWQASVTFSKQGKLCHYTYEDMPCIQGKLFVNAKHHIEMKERIC